MTQHRPVATAFLAAACAAALAVGCNKQADKPAADKPASEKAGGETAIKIAGLATEKEQVSYMIGMSMGKQLELAKDEVDVDTIAKAIKASIAGEKLLMTEEQAKQVGEAFGQKMQAKQIADAMAKAKKNAEAGTKFLAENGKKPGVTTTASGLQYQVITQGKGARLKTEDVASVHYKGTTLDGKTFDSSYDRGQPAQFPLGGIVPGMREGLLLMPVGSKFKLWIPSKLGYGENVPPGAPFGPNETLVFEVELLDIVKPGATPTPAGAQ